MCFGALRRAREDFLNSFACMRPAGAWAGPALGLRPGPPATDPQQARTRTYGAMTEAEEEPNSRSGWAHEGNAILVVFWK